MSFQLSKHQLQYHSLMPKYNSFLIFKIFSITYETIPNGKTLICTLLLFSLTFILTSILKSQGEGQRKGLYVHYCILLFNSNVPSVENLYRTLINFMSKQKYRLYFPFPIFSPRGNKNRFSCHRPEIREWVGLFLWYKYLDLYRFSPKND